VRNRGWIGLMMLAPAGVGQAAESGAVPVPAAVRAIEGCWRGTGTVMGKTVDISLAAHPVLLDAMVAIDADSTAQGDAKDRYAVHLLFGGGEHGPEVKEEPVTGFWADSFGGGFTATGAGHVHADGFEIVYRYPDADFVNQWQLTGGKLRWAIVARDAAGKDKPFASYLLDKGTCPAAR
jgi:hypothetical protein